MSIKMAADYFGLPYSLSHIDTISRCRQRGGLTNIELITTLRRIGLRVRTQKNSSWRDLQALNTKDHIIILSWMLEGYIGHFSVLDKVTREHIYLADPDLSDIKKMQKLQFLRLWFDYDNIWYPRKLSDVQLRWMAVVSEC